VNPREPVTFEEFAEYVAFLAEHANPGLRGLRLPKTNAEFDIWWRRILLCDDLRDRWTRRIRLRERFLQELAEEIAAIGKAA
jgi:hypothetical protein